MNDSGNYYQPVLKTFRWMTEKELDSPMCHCYRSDYFLVFRKTKLNNGENRMSIALIKPSILTSLSEPPETVCVLMGCTASSGMHESKS